MMLNLGEELRLARIKRESSNNATKNTSAQRPTVPILQNPSNSTLKPEAPMLHKFPESNVEIKREVVAAATPCQPTSLFKNDEAIEVDEVLLKSFMKYAEMKIHGSSEVVLRQKMAMNGIQREKVSYFFKNIEKYIAEYKTSKNKPVLGTNKATAKVFSSSSVAPPITKPSPPPPPPRALPMIKSVVGDPEIAHSSSPSMSHQILTPSSSCSVSLPTSAPSNEGNDDSDYQRLLNKYMDMKDRGISDIGIKQKMENDRLSEDQMQRILAHIKKNSIKIDKSSKEDGDTSTVADAVNKPTTTTTIIRERANSTTFKNMRAKLSSMFATPTTPGIKPSSTSGTTAPKAKKWEICSDEEDNKPSTIVTNTATSTGGSPMSADNKEDTIKSSVKESLTKAASITPSSSNNTFKAAANMLAKRFQLTNPSISNRSSLTRDLNGSSDDRSVISSISSPSVSSPRVTDDEMRDRLSEYRYMYENLNTPIQVVTQRMIQDGLKKQELEYFMTHYASSSSCSTPTNIHNTNMNNGSMNPNTNNNNYMGGQQSNHYQQSTVATTGSFSPQQSSSYANQDQAYLAPNPNNNNNNNNHMISQQYTGMPQSVSYTTYPPGSTSQQPMNSQSVTMSNNTYQGSTTYQQQQQVPYQQQPQQSFQQQPQQSFQQQPQQSYQQQSSYPSMTQQPSSSAYAQQYITSHPTMSVQYTYDNPSYYPIDDTRSAYSDSLSSKSYASTADCNTMYSYGSPNNAVYPVQVIQQQQQQQMYASPPGPPQNLRASRINLPSPRQVVDYDYRSSRRSSLSTASYSTGNGSISSNPADFIRRTPPTEILYVPVQRNQLTSSYVSPMSQQQSVQYPDIRRHEEQVISSLPVHEQQRLRRSGNHRMLRLSPATSPPISPRGEYTVPLETIDEYNPIMRRTPSQMTNVASMSLKGSTGLLRTSSGYSTSLYRSNNAEPSVEFISDESMYLYPGSTTSSQYNVTSTTLSPSLTYASDRRAPRPRNLKLDTIPNTTAPVPTTNKYNNTMTNTNSTASTGRERKGSLFGRLFSSRR